MANASPAPSEHQADAGAAHVLAPPSAKSKDTIAQFQFEASDQLSWLVELLRCSRGPIAVDVGGSLLKVACIGSTVADAKLPNSASGELGHCALSFDCKVPGTRVEFIKLEARCMTGVTPGDLPRCRIAVTGGGAHNYACLAHEDATAVGEFEGVARGVTWLLTTGWAPDGAEELYKYAENRAVFYEVEEMAARELIVVNMGSGVSVLHVKPGKGEERISGAEYSRVGGTSIGGGTFCGLTKLLAAAASFGDAVDLSAEGDSGKVNLRIEDIYGRDFKFEECGLSGQANASVFAKCTEATDITQADLACAVMDMVCETAVNVARLCAQKVAIDVGCDLGGMAVLFVGGFLRNNGQARRRLARQADFVGLDAWFLKHSDYAGTLGALHSVL